MNSVDLTDEECDREPALAEVRQVVRLFEEHRVSAGAVLVAVMSACNERGEYIIPEDMMPLLIAVIASVNPEMHRAMKRLAKEKVLSQAN